MDIQSPSYVEGKERKILVGVLWRMVAGVGWVALEKMAEDRELLVVHERGEVDLTWVS